MTTITPNTAVRGNMSAAQTAPVQFAGKRPSNTLTGDSLTVSRHGRQGLLDGGIASIPILGGLLASTGGIAATLLGGVFCGAKILLALCGTCIALPIALGAGYFGFRKVKNIISGFRA